MTRVPERLVDGHVALVGDIFRVVDVPPRAVPELLEGRPLLEALPRAVDDIEDYEWHEGEVLGGMVLGWNFGDGHLNDKQLLDAVQQQCEFEDGELRVIMVESQPLFRHTMKWRIADAKRGILEEGETDLEQLRDLLGLHRAQTRTAPLDAGEIIDPAPAALGGHGADRTA